MPDFKQSSFSGGINLLLDDTRLPVNIKNKEGDNMYETTYSQYRCGFNLRNRFDVLSPIKSSKEDVAAPPGIKQGCLTFGNFIVLFVGGYAYYRYFQDIKWTQIDGFKMLSTATRFWFVEVPVSTTNYGRIAIPAAITSGGPEVVQANLPIAQVNVVAGTSGDVPGLLVQDGVSQPQFIYLDPTFNTVKCKVTQQYDQWSYDPAGVADKREYVPVGTFMEWFDGILFIVDPTYNIIYRSVSGRPLDFVVNIDENGDKGGDATTTAYSVGVGGITCIKALSSNSLFVSAGNSICFSVELNTSQNAPKIFGEYTFIRTVLFNASCMSDRGIIDVLGDTNFIDLNGLRSFNAIEQQQNEGRNSVFSATVASLFDGIFQNALKSSAILFDNYAIFSVLTTIGYVLIVYDTINNCYSSIDNQQLGNHAVKQFCKLEISAHALYCITDDDKFVQLYAKSSFDSSTVRFGSLCSQDPKKELKVNTLRLILSGITEDTSITCTMFVNNRQSGSPLTTTIRYTNPPISYNGSSLFTDINTQVNNILFSWPNSNQGWKVFFLVTWTGGASITNVSTDIQELTPLQPLLTQAVINL